MCNNYLDLRDSFLLVMESCSYVFITSDDYDSCMYPRINEESPEECFWRLLHNDYFNEDSPFHESIYVRCPDFSQYEFENYKDYER
jgi:hypothetical protein